MSIQLWQNIIVVCKILVANQICKSSSSGGATTIAPSSWTNSSLAAIFEKKYTKAITTFWPYRIASTTTEDRKSGGFPSWAAAVVGVLSGLLIVGLLVGFWCYRRRRNQPLSASVQETKSADNTEDTKTMHQISPTSPEPGPPSQSTGMETVQYSTISAATPVTVESGGDAVYEMQGMSQKLVLSPLSTLTTEN